MDRILGLPIHPLLVHAPVVIVPAFCLAAICYALAPRLRPRFGWVVITLSILAPLSTLGAWWSGHRFYDLHVEMIGRAGSDPARFRKLLAEHLAFGDILVWLLPAAAVAVWALILLHRRRTVPAGQSGPSPLHRAATVTLIVAVCGLCAASGWYTFQSGHSGAEVVWGQEKN